MRAVTITGGFWGQRREINLTKSIPTMHDLLDANGRMNNFRRLVGKSTAPQSGPVFSDSDVYKWTEAVGFVLQSGDRPELRASADKLIDEVVAVQEPSGYLNTYYQDDRKSLRMLPQTQTTGHELYNIGHMLQGAIAYYRATGDRKLLDAGIRFVDDFLIPNYGPAPKKPIVSGHPEIEMGLIELYRITGDKRQLDLAGYILQGDKRIELPERRTIYMFSGTPFTERTKMEGHAVRADVCLLRRHRLLPGNRRSNVPANAEQALGTIIDHYARCTSPVELVPGLTAKRSAMLTSCPIPALTAKAALPSET